MHAMAHTLSLIQSANLTLTPLEQNFSAIQKVYSKKLKKLKEASKPGAVVPMTVPTAGK